MLVSKTFENSSLRERSVAALAASLDEGVATLLPASKRLAASWEEPSGSTKRDRVSGKNLIPTLGELIVQKAVESQARSADTISLSSA